MTEDDFKNRTKQISLRIINLVNALPVTTTSTAMGKQLILNEVVLMVLASIETLRTNRVIRTSNPKSKIQNPK